MIEHVRLPQHACEPRTVLAGTGDSLRILPSLYSRSDLLFLLVFFLRFPPDDGTEDDRHGSGRGSGKGRGKGAAGAHLTPGGSSGDRGSASSNLKRIRSTTSQDPRLASPATYPHLTPLAGNGVLPNVSDLYVHLNESKGSVHYDLARLVANAQVTDSTCESALYLRYQ